MHPQESIDASSDNKPLNEFQELKRRYGGPLSQDHVRHIAEALRDIVPNGRYTSRAGLGPVCVVARDCDRVVNGFAHVVVVYTSHREPGEFRSSVENFLDAFRFFATDCA